MGKIVKLSEKSQALIKQYIELSCPKTSDIHSFSSEVDADVLVTWLTSEVVTPTNVAKKSKQELEFILASLRVELLRDLLVSMGIEQEELRKEEKPPSKMSRFKFYLLAISGAAVAACEGFDSITTLLGVFSLPSVVTLLAGIAFSALSVTVFAGFNLAQVSKNLGVKLTDAPKLLDLYVLQMKEIKSLRKKIETYKLATLPTEELERLMKLTAMLQKRFDSLASSSKQFEAALNSPKVKIAKTLFGALSGILFFGSGFFAGQSVAIFLLGLVMSGGVTAGFAPVILFSLAVGFAAFSLYWYVEKVGLQQLISGWFGLDEEKIEGLCNQEKLDAQSQKLSNLKEKLESTAELTRKLDTMKQPKVEAPLDDEFVLKAPPKVAATASPETPIKASANMYSFHQSVEDEHSEVALVEDERACLIPT